MTQDDPMTDTFDESLDPAAPIARSDEPRGPHLPDVLTQLPFGVWIFGLLAIARLVWFVRETQLGSLLEPTVVLSFTSGITPAVVAVLLPAALLLRHPDAWTGARTLLVGTIIFAVVEGLRVLGPLLQPLFEQATPGSEETPYVIPLALLYTTVQGLLAAFAVANIGLGLAQARRFLDRSAGLAIVGVAGAIIVFVAVTRVVSVSQLPFDQIPMSPTVAAYLASVIVLGVLSIGAWAYLAATTARGARAGEDPGAGWTVGAAGAWLIVVAFVLSAAGNVVRPTEETQELFTNLGYGISIIHTLGYLALLGALLLGMPSLDPLEEDDGDDWEDEEGWDDEDDDVGDSSFSPDRGDNAGATDTNPAPDAGTPGSID